MNQPPSTPRDIGQEGLSSAPASLDTAGQATPPSASPSLTYEPYYGLREKPFSLSSDPRFLYRSPTHEPAFSDLLSGIRRREGLIVLTGEIGTGKTTLIRSVLPHLDQRTFTAFVPDPFVSREDLLKILLVDFGVVSVADLKRGSLAGASRPELSYPLYEFLDSLVPLQAFAVLIIDEAQNLPLPLLEEIRVLSDLEQREKLLQVVLVGQPELRSNMKMPEMRQVDQRVSVRCELSPLGREDVGAYVRHRLAIAGGGECRVAFAEPALDVVTRRSGGVPRLINLICDRSLQRGHAAGVFVIGPDHAEEAFTSLGLDAVVPKAIVTTPVGGDHERLSGESVHVDAKQTEPPTVARWTAPSVRVVDTDTQPPQLLSEFAAEADMAVASVSPTPFLAPEAEQAHPEQAEQKTPTRPMLAAAIVTAAAGTLLLVYFAARAMNFAATVLPPAPTFISSGSSAAVQPPADEGTEQALASIEPTIAAAEWENEERFAIQVASFQSRGRAARLVKELVDAGLRARAVEFDLGPPLGRVLQVRIDGYKTAKDASRDLARIRELPGYADARLLKN